MANGFIDEPTNDGLYITFTGETSDFTLKATNKEWNGTVEYSTDTETWTEWNGTEISSSGQKLYLRGNGNTTFYTKSGARFVLSALAGCSGNLNTLLQYDNPSTTLSNNCYRSMFQGCTNLTQAPELPATTLSNNCYQYMFQGCTNLTQAPELPATTLAASCYRSMFQGCTNLTQAPELPATTLASYCYYFMFRDCSSFKVSETQTGAYQYTWRIPTSGTISSTSVNWNIDMLDGTGGTFTSDPSINTTYYLSVESSISFKHYYKNTMLIGTGTYKFRPYTVIQPQLSTPANISADGTTVSWDEVENATGYEILADGTSIGEVSN